MTSEEKKSLERLHEKVDAIATCLMGREDDHKDSGLVGAVKSNTMFRVWLTRGLGASFTAGLGLLALKIRSLFGINQ